MTILARFAPHLAVIAAIAGIIWWIDDRAADRTRGEIAAANAATAIRMQSELRQSEQRIANAVHTITGNVASQIARIDTSRTIIQPTITREIALDPRYTDPAAGLSDGLLKAINDARSSFSCTATAHGGIECTLPATEPDR